MENRNARRESDAGTGAAGALAGIGDSGILPRDAGESAAAYADSGLALGGVHDPGRIRGDALRRSLYYTLIAWIPGAFWQGATSGATVTEMGKFLGANDFLLSFLIGAAPLLAVLFQLPGAMVVERLGTRKKFFIWTVTPHRVLYIVVGLLPWITPRNVAWPATVMGMLILISTGMSHLGGQAWTNWMADLVPSRVRGKYFARRSRMGVAVIALTMLGLAVIFDLCAEPWFVHATAAIPQVTGLSPLIFMISIVFMLAGFIGMFDILSFTRVDEPPMKKVPREPMISRLSRPLHDVPFRRFVAYWSLWTFATSFNGWVWWVYLLDFLQSERAKPQHSWWSEHMYLAATLILTVGFSTGQFLSYPIWGRAVDRFGRKPVLFLSSMLHTTGWTWWLFLGPKILPWLILTQLVSGFMSGGQDIASFNMMLQFNRRGGPGYQALASVVFGLAGAAAAVLLAGLLATALQSFAWTPVESGPWEHTFNRYAVLVAVGYLCKFAADLLLLPRVIDVGDRPASHALRFMFDNMYGNLNTLIFEPIRSGVELTGRSINEFRGAAGTSFRRWWR